MGARSRELILLLVVCTFALSQQLVNKTRKDKELADNDPYQFDEYDADDQEVLFNEERPCPRDCICTVSQGYRIAKCNRLEIGTQKFGEDITDLVIENADPRYPIELHDFIFKMLGLHRVATIKIVNSTIGSVEPNAFLDLPELYSVNLSNNKLKSLHPQTFAHNKKLLLLTLANNPLKFPNVNSEDYFLNASSVQELDVSYCNMRTITTNSFRNMTGLMYLNLSGNNLTSLNTETFKKLLDLEELDLSDNNLTSLPSNIFSDNTELATLHIQKNPIDTVYGLQIVDLLTLNAGQTNIKFVGPSMFNGMLFIANLNLSGNNIEKIHNQAFHSLQELNFLDLSYNDLDMVSDVLIKDNIELDIFKISNNPKIKHLPVKGFNCSVDAFNIYLFEAANCGLEEVYDDSLKTFTSLSQINLSNNNIKSISSKVFSRCTKLVEINLAHNMLTMLDVKIFEQNNELTKLNLQGNPIKVLSADIFTHTPILSWLDISYAELTSLWKVEKNQSTSLLSNLSFLNASHNRINEIKHTELDSLNKLKTLDINHNPLACSRDFENLMTWLSKRKVSPNSNSANIANLARDNKEEEESYTWEFLTLQTCGSALPISHPVELLPAVSDEEIWERVDKDDVGNFDLKDTLDDAKVADDKLINNTLKTNDVDDDEDEDEADDGEDETYDDDDDDDGEDTSNDEYDDNDDNVSIKVKLIETTSIKPKSAKKVTTETPKTEPEVKIAIKLLEKDNLYDDLEPEVYIASPVSESDHGHYDYLWPMLIAILGALLLLIVIAKIVMVVCSRRDRQVRYNSAIIAAMSNPANRTKKDCGLVYQQLSEDLTGPATPKLNRYAPLHSVTIKASNMYESSPFHHNNIVPEAV